MLPCPQTLIDLGVRECMKSLPPFLSERTASCSEQLAIPSRRPYPWQWRETLCALLPTPRSVRLGSGEERTKSAPTLQGSTTLRDTCQLSSSWW